MTSDLEKYRQQALELWFNNGGSCTGAQPPEPKDIDDAIAEDEEFKRIEKQHITKNIGKHDRENELSFLSVIENKGNNIFLKCDIEGSEYDILNDILIHTKLFSGIVIEFHDIQDNFKLNEMANFVSKLDQKLVHVHINNYSYTQIGENQYIPSVVELSFISSDNIKLKKHITFPNSLDMPNCPEREDFTIVF